MSWRRVLSCRSRERLVLAFNRVDSDAMAELYVKDAVNHQVIWEPLVGRDAMQEMFEREFRRTGRASRALECPIQLEAVVAATHGIGEDSEELRGFLS